MNLSKTTTLCVDEDLQSINSREDSIEVVSDFTYLGAVVKARGELVKDVEHLETLRHFLQTSVPW